MAVTHILFFQDSNALLWPHLVLRQFFSWISSLCSLVICWCLFIISVISISRLVRLFTIVLYLLKPVSITYYLALVYDNCWLFYYFPFLTYIQIHIFHLNSLFRKFLHMFVLPVVASSSIAGVGFVHVMFSIVDIPCGFTATLNIILSYKFYFAFLWHKIYIYFLYEYIYIYVGMLELYFYRYLWHNFQFFNMSRWIFSHKCIAYKVFQ